MRTLIRRGSDGLRASEHWLLQAGRTAAFWLVLAFVAIAYLAWDDHNRGVENRHLIVKVEAAAASAKETAFNLNAEAHRRRATVNSVFVTQCSRLNDVTKAVSDFHDFFLRVAKVAPPNEQPQARAVRLKFLRVVGTDLPVLRRQNCARTLAKLQRSGG